MSFVNGTPHYNLPQTVGTDKRDWFDTNEPFATIDAAIHTANQTASSAAAKAATLEDRVDDIDVDIAGIKSDITEAQGDINGLDMRVNGLDGKVDDNYIDLTDAICSVKEVSATAQYTHTQGEYFWYNDTLYRARTNINVGQQIVPNTNCDTVTVMTQICKGSVYVTANGVKTYGTLLNELGQLTDFTKLGNSSVLEIIGTNNIGSYYSCSIHESRSHEYIADVADFSKQQCTGPASIMVANVHINKQESTDTFFANIIINSPVGSFTASDMRSDVPASGVKIGIIY